jgi:hypothetical protein
MYQLWTPFARSSCRGTRIITALFFAALLLAPGCGEPEPGGPGRVAGSRAGLDSSGQLPPPRIEFASVEHDFGEIDEGQSVSHRFSFRNSGQSLLFIRNVKPS